KPRRDRNVGESPALRVCREYRVGKGPRRRLEARAGMDAGVRGEGRDGRDKASVDRKSHPSKIALRQAQGKLKGGASANQNLTSGYGLGAGFSSFFIGVIAPAAGFGFQNSGSALIHSSRG